MSEYNEFQQRVVNELKELVIKVVALGSFIASNKIFPTLPKEEQDRLMRQHAAMLEYVAVLEERVTAFS